MSRKRTAADAALNKSPSLRSTRLKTGVPLQPTARALEAAKTVNKKTTRRKPKKTTPAPRQTRAPKQPAPKKTRALKKTSGVTWRSPLEEPGNEPVDVPSSPPIIPEAVEDEPPYRIISSEEPPVSIPSTPPPPSPLIPALSSSPARGPDYDVAVQYAIFVNGSRKIRHTELDTPRQLVDMLDMEDAVGKLIANPQSSVDGREYTYQGREVAYRPDKKNSVYRYYVLPDFSNAEARKMWGVIDKHVSHAMASRLDMRVEIRITVKALEKAFTRTVLDPSSDPPVSTPVNRTRTNQLLKEAEQLEKAQQMRTRLDHVGSIHKFWACTVTACNNFQRWCYVHPATRDHFEIKENEIESWAQGILKGECTVMAPPIRLIEHWQTRPSKLAVNPHTGRSRGKGQQRTASSSDDDGSSAIMAKLLKQMQQQQMQSQIMRMQEMAAERDERYGQQLADRESRQAQPLLDSLAFLRAPTYPPAAALGTSTRRNPTSSSPVSGAGRIDTRGTTRAFMKWLVEQQPEEDRAEYERAREVAIEQMWTIEDLKSMSTSSSELYKVATSEPFKLKDGVVRHFREDLRVFKPVFRSGDM